MNFIHCLLLFLLAHLLIAFGMGVCTESEGSLKPDFQFTVEPYAKMQTELTGMEEKLIDIQENLAKGFNAQLTEHEKENLKQILDAYKKVLLALPCTQTWVETRDKIDNEFHELQKDNIGVVLVPQIRKRTHDFMQLLNTIVVENLVKSMHKNSGTMEKEQNLNKWLHKLDENEQKLDKMLAFIASNQTLCAAAPFEHAKKQILQLKGHLGVGQNILQKIIKSISKKDAKEANAKLKEIVDKLTEDVVFSIQYEKWVKPYKEIQTAISALEDELNIKENFEDIQKIDAHLLFNLKSKLDLNNLWAYFYSVGHKINCVQLGMLVDKNGGAFYQAYLREFLAILRTTIRGFTKHYSTHMINKKLERIITDHNNENHIITDHNNENHIITDHNNENQLTNLKIILAFINDNKTYCDVALFEQAKASILSSIACWSKEIFANLALNVKFNALKNEFAASLGSPHTAGGTSVVYYSSEWHSIEFKASKDEQYYPYVEKKELRQQMLEWAKEAQPKFLELKGKKSAQLQEALSQFDALISKHEAAGGDNLNVKYLAFCHAAVSAMQHVGDDYFAYDIIDYILSTSFEEMNYVELFKKLGVLRKVIAGRKKKIDDLSGFVFEITD